jgi:Uncharacterized protein conserved in bacteria (DUF2155)
MRARISALVLLLLATTIGSAACRERGRPDPNIRMAVSHEPAPADAGKKQGKTVPTKLVVPPEVTAAYSGIRLGWKDSQTGKSGTVEVPIGGKAPLPGSDLEVRADVYLPSFSMTSEEITSSSTGEENPAARIGVAEKGKEIFAGWIFTRFPDVHPFQHPRFSLTLEGGVPRKAA